MKFQTIRLRASAAVRVFCQNLLNCCPLLILQLVTMVLFGLLFLAGGRA